MSSDHDIQISASLWLDVVGQLYACRVIDSGKGPRGNSLCHAGVERLRQAGDLDLYGFGIVDLQNDIELSFERGIGLKLTIIAIQYLWSAGLDRFCEPALDACIEVVSIGQSSLDLLAGRGSLGPG
jgi:hypothetical protein